MPSSTKSIHKNALRPLKSDDRDFSRSQVFGEVSELPTHDFLVAVPLEIKNQDINYPSDFCTAYAAASVAEDQAQVIFCPEWTFAQAKGLKALSDPSAYIEYGLDLRDICQVAVKKGFLPRNLDTFHCDTPARPSRDFIAVPDNWGTLKDYDSPYKMGPYFKVDGNRDFFDNCRSVLFMHLGERDSILTGCMWRDSWSKSPLGVIPKTYDNNESGHAIKIFGQKTINGEIYLVAQLSDGVGFGDKGYFYIPRDVANAEFAQFGAFYFPPINRKSALWHVTNGVAINDPWIIKCWKVLAHFIGL